METKYTDGPWKISCDYYGVMSVGPGIFDVVAEIQQNEKAGCNARLISCAPDLLKIAVAAMKYIESIPNDSNINYEGEKIDKQWAEKVISIATSVEY
jgi:Asp/Glu/hydantoin racemase